MNKKPNILFIQADQLTSEVLPAFNSEGQAITPNITKLAKDGVLFENCYCNSPLCTPSRASMYTGTRTSHNEVWGNGSELKSDVPTWLHFMKIAGYRTISSGKEHFIGPDQLHGFDKRLTTDMYPSNYDWSIDWLPKVEYRPGTSVKRLEVSGECRTNSQLLYDAEVQFRSLEFLRYEALDPKSSPFFLHVSFTQPHDTYQSIPKYWDMYKNVEIKPPKKSADSEQDQHITTKWVNIHHGLDKYTPTEQMILDSRRGYYAMITHLDEYVGELMDELKLLGLYDDTLIIFTSDHGDMLGERGMWFKRTFFEQAIKVPMIFHYPKAYAPKREKRTISLMDLFPTFSDIVDSNVEFENDGDSLKNVLESEDSEWKDEAVIEYYGPGTEAPWYCLRKNQWKYIYTKDQDPLLYNMDQDPLEENNLVDHAEYQTIREKMHEQLLNGIDVNAIAEKAVNNKKTRRLIHEALSGSEGYCWDYQTKFDGSKQYVRSSINRPSFC